MMNTDPISTQMALKSNKLIAAMAYLVPSISVVLLVLIDFQVKGKLGLINRPYLFACITSLLGLGVAILCRAVSKKLLPVITYSIVQFGISLFVFWLFFMIFVRDSL